MNREQQRQNTRDQRRLEQQQRARQRGTRPAQPELRRQPLAATPAAAAKSAPLTGKLPSWWPWAAAVAAIVAILALLYFLDPLGLRTPLPGKSIQTQGNQHVNPGDSHVAYSTDPPASGPHFPTVPRRGIYTTPFTTEFLPHFMEHGGVVVQYNSSAPPDTVKKLTDIVSGELDKGLGLVLMAPRPDMPCAVALTAWMRAEAFGAKDCLPGSVGHELNLQSSKDVSAVKDFVERNQCVYDPENQCGSGSTGKTVYPTPKPGEPTVTVPIGAAPPASGAPSGTPVPATPAP